MDGGFSDPVWHAGMELLKRWTLLIPALKSDIQFDINEFLTHTVVIIAQKGR